MKPKKDREAMDDLEEIAQDGLDIRGFHFKWKHAKQYELNSPRTDDTKYLPYWERVRLTFLESGGQYVNQKYGQIHPTITEY